MSVLLKKQVANRVERLQNRLKRMADTTAERTQLDSLKTARSAVAATGGRNKGLLKSLDRQIERLNKRLSGPINTDSLKGELELWQDVWRRIPMDTHPEYNRVRKAGAGRPKGKRSKSGKKAKAGAQSK